MALVRTVGILGYAGVNAVDLTGPAEVFANATRIGSDGRASRCYEVLVIGVAAGPFAAESGVVFLPAMDMHDAPELDTLVIPGGIGMRVDGSDARIDAWIRERAAHTRRVASVCTGAFALARAGLLDGRRAATHWRFADALRTQFPRVDVDAGALFVKDGRFYTAAGVTAGIDLALALVEEDEGPQVALTVAREMVVYLKRNGGQEQYSEPLKFQARAVDAFDELVPFMLSNLRQDLSVAALAERSHLGARQFSRRFKALFGTTPAEFVLSLRLDESCNRLTMPRSNVDRIARSVGFHSAQAFRRAFERRYGLSPKAYRERFMAAL